MSDSVTEHYKVERLRDRPFDFYAAFIVLFAGSYSFFDPTFPERLPTPIYWLVVIEDLYLVISGVALMAALLMKHFNKQIVHAFEIEMFAWQFVSAAAAVIVLTSPWVPPTVITPEDPVLILAWAGLWLGLALAAGSRAYYIRAKVLLRVDK